MYLLAPKCHHEYEAENQQREIIHLSHEDEQCGKPCGEQELCHRHTLSLHTPLPAHVQWVGSLFRKE
jgi:hypothetical protein